MRTIISMRADLAQENMAVPASRTFSNYDTLDDDLYITAEELEGAEQGNDPADPDDHPFCYLTLKDGRSLYFISADLDFEYIKENEMQGLDAHLNKQLADYQAELDKPVRGKDLTRQQLITWLIDNDINDWNTEASRFDYFHKILLDGFEGYENMTTSELVDEYDQRND